MEGIGRPQDFNCGKLEQASSSTETAASGTDWNVTGPVDELGRENGDHAADESNNEENVSHDPN